MEPTRISTQVRVKHCSLCQGDIEYYCHHCQQNLCLQCENIHVIDIDTKDHEVTRYAEKAKTPPKQVMSARSEDTDNLEPCGVPVSDPCPEHVMCARSLDPDNHEPCEVPVSDPCPEHVMNARSGDNQEPCEAHMSDFYPIHGPWRFLLPVWLSPLEDSRHDEIERRLYSERIYHLRGETLYYRHVLLEGLRRDVNSGHKEVTIQGQGKAKERAQGLKDLIDEVLTGNLYDRCQIQKTRLSKHIDELEKYERRYEEYASRAVKYLRFIKHKHDPHKDEQKIINRLVKFMKGMQLSTETGKRQAGNELLLTLMPSAFLQKFLRVKDVIGVLHISFVTPDRIWVSDKNKLILTEIRIGDKLHSLDDSFRLGTGSHTVNSECELIYIDKDRNFNQLSDDLKTTATLRVELIEEPESIWIPQCVYCSLTTMDLHVGKIRHGIETDTRTGEVMRYNNIGKRTQTIPQDNKHITLYKCPTFITENNNGDVVVSDCDRRAVVVTERGGKYRFSYTGPPSGSGVGPSGIVTDVLSHILVKDGYTATVQMISKDGEFLTYLLTREPPWIDNRLWCLSYDVNTHLLWVGSWDDNMVSVYRYIKIPHCNR